MMTEETEEEYKLGSAVTGTAGRRRDDCPVILGDGLSGVLPSPDSGGLDPGSGSKLGVYVRLVNGRVYVGRVGGWPSVRLG